MCLANFEPFLQFEDILATFSCVACVLGLRLSLALRQLIASLARCRAWSREHRIIWNTGKPSAVGEAL